MITKEELEQAMQTIYKWAVENKVRYFDLYAFPRKPKDIEHPLLFTYQKSNKRTFNYMSVEKEVKK